MNFTSTRVENLPKAVIGKLMKIAEENREIISLGPGEPDFDSPKISLNAGIRAIKEKRTHYSPIGGRNDFKEAVIYKLKVDNKIGANKENIIATCGSTEALYLGLMAIMNPKDSVVVPDPGFLAYKPMIELLNGKPVSLPLKQEEGFEFNPDILEEIVKKENPKVLILNTPSNPTGTALSKKTLEEIANLSLEYNFLIFSDEAYEHFIYENAKHYSVGSFKGMENNVLTFHSFSKTFAMPGFRLGYTVGREDIIKNMTKLHVYTTLAAPTISQVIAEKTLHKWKSIHKDIEKMRKSYDRRRKLILKRLSEIQVFNTHNPKGAFYMFPSFCLKKKMTSLQFSEWLLKNSKVAVLPGTEFGSCGEGFVRMSYATGYELIEEAMDRIEKSLKRFN